MQKTINPAATLCGNTYGQIFCKISITDGKLSISGVIAPKSNGDSRGGAGQIDMEFKHRNPAHDDKRYSDPIPASALKFNKGWSADNWLEFLEVWKLWHLNDMQPNCEHQTGGIWESKTVKIAHYRLNSETLAKKSAIEDRTKEQLKTDGAATITPKEQELLNMPWALELPADGKALDMLKYYELKNTEEKNTGWLDESEHPEGILSRACPVCGYKYGSAWRKKELPQNIINFLETLPETERVPAWV